jgi:hypothetical protein
VVFEKLLVMETLVLADRGFGLPEADLEVGDTASLEAALQTDAAGELCSPKIIAVPIHSTERHGSLRYMRLIRHFRVLILTS